MDTLDIKIPSTEVQSYDFNLDLPGIDRWKSIFDNFSEEDIEELRDHGKKILSALGSTISIISLGIKAYPRESIMYIDELEYISKRCGMEFYEVLLLQMVYEANSMCTSAILKVEDKKYFFRTMDWNMPFLKKYTMRLNIIKQGTSIAEAVGWLGMVGFFHCD